MTERDGWIRLGAYNFTFSRPTVKVKFIQDAPVPKATPTATPKATETSQSASSNSAKTQVKITCVKGKTKKVLTSKSCPKGYKKV